MGRRKGFTTTLESVLASMLFLLFVINVLPTFTGGEETGEPLGREVEEVLRSLDRAGRLRPLVLEQDLAGIQSAVTSYVTGINVGVGLSYVNITEGKYTGGSLSRNFTVNKSVTTKELLYLWIDAADAVDVDVNGEDVMETSDTGFKSAAIQDYTRSGENNLTIDSTSGDLWYGVQIYSRERNRELPDSNVNSMSYMVAGMNDSFQPSEVTVFTWR